MSPAADLRKLLKACLEKGTPIAERYRRIGQVNESFCQGDQWSSIEINGGNVRKTSDAWWRNVPKIHVNLINNLMLAWSALLLKERLTATAVPASDDDPEDAYNAEIAQALFTFIARELDAATKLHQAVKYACQHGTGGLKIFYDKSTDALAWAPLTIFNYIIDPVADYKRAGWVVFENHRDVEEAEDLFERAGIKRKPKVTKYKNSAGEELSGVVSHELWLRPTREHPQGKYVCFVDGEPVEDTPYPYVIENDSGKPEYLLPLVLMKVRDIRDSAYGATNLTDSVPLQRSYNEIVSRMVLFVRRTTAAHLKLPKEIRDFKFDDDAVIRFPGADAAAAQAIGWTQPATMSPSLFDLRDFFRSSMNEVMGINEITSGSETRTLSGRAIENIRSLDMEKNGDASKAAEAMVLDAYRLSAAIVQITYTVPRKMRITGGTAQDVWSFDGADIKGVDVRLEPASELDEVKSVKRLAKTEQVQAGAAPQSELDRLVNPANYGHSKERSEQIVASYLAGESVDLSVEDVQPDVLTAVVQRHKARALREGRKSDWLALHRLTQDIQGLNAQADDVATQEPAPVEEAPLAG